MEPACHLSDNRADKSFEEKLRRASILDQLSIPYPKVRSRSHPSGKGIPDAPQHSLFRQNVWRLLKRRSAEEAYKRGLAAEIRRQLRSDHAVNGVANRLRAISGELDRLGPS